MSFFLVPSQNSNTPLYPQSAASQGACPNSLLFRCFHFILVFESIKELGAHQKPISNKKNEKIPTTYQFGFSKF